MHLLKHVNLFGHLTFSGTFVAAVAAFLRVRRSSSLTSDPCGACTRDQRSTDSHRHSTLILTFTNESARTHSATRFYWLFLLFYSSRRTLRPAPLHKQHDVPAGKHALITVRQPKGNLVWVQTQQQSLGGGGAGSGGGGGGGSGGLGSGKLGDKEKFQPRISTWDECDSVQVCLRRDGRSLFDNSALTYL